MGKTFVAVLMGSDSDVEIMQSTFKTLKELGIAFEARILSAHRTPFEVHDYVQQAEQRGCAVFIAAAGLAAHLAGAIASLTTKPVIGVPIEGGSLRGMDALLSTVQMPGGIPVATTAIGKPGAKNAAVLAAQILATADQQLADTLKRYRAQMSSAVMDKDRRLQEQFC